MQFVVYRGICMKIKIKKWGPVKELEYDFSKSVIVTYGDPVERKDCFHPCLKSKYIDNDRLKYMDFRGDYAKNRRLFIELAAAVIGVEDLDQFIAHGSI